MEEQNDLSTMDLAGIAQIAARYKDEPDQLMRILLEIQSHCGNSIPREAAVEISRVTGIPEAKLYGYITFYAMFSDRPRGKYIIRRCKSAPCHIVGAREVARAIGDCLGIAPGVTTEDGLFTLEYCEYIGMCDTGPALMINDSVYSGLTPESAVELISSYRQGGAE